MTIRAIDLAGLDAPSRAIVVRAVMAHPQNDQRREELEALLLAELYAASQMAFPSHILPPLIRAAERGAGRDFEKASGPGRIAGDVLLYLVAMNHAGRVKDLGLDRAQYVVSRLHAQRPISRDSVRRHWKAFRPVAHLWAAESLVRDRTPEGEPADYIGDHGPSLVGLAEALRLSAEATRLPSKFQIQSSELICLLGAETVNVCPGEIPEEAVEALMDFASRSKEVR